MRRAVVWQFPFAVYFRPDGEKVVIVAIFHTS
jgi:hypothetical protein